MDRWDSLVRLARDDEKRLSALEMRLDKLLTQRNSCARRCESLEERMGTVEDALYRTMTLEIAQLTAKVDRISEIVSKW